MICKSKLFLLHIYWQNCCDSHMLDKKKKKKANKLNIKAWPRTLNWQKQHSSFISLKQWTHYEWYIDLIYNLVVTWSYFDVVYGGRVQIDTSPICFASMQSSTLAWITCHSFNFHGVLQRVPGCPPLTDSMATPYLMTSSLIKCLHLRDFRG